MPETGTYKNFRSDDINTTRRVISQDLFNTHTVLQGLFDENNYEIETINEGELAPVTYVKRTETDVYFSYVRGEYHDISDIYNQATTEGQQSNALMYYQMVQLLGIQSEKYDISTDQLSTESEKIEIVSISRNYYKDMLDRNFFAFFLKSDGTVINKFTSSTVALIPSDKVRSSDIGRRVYLYPYTGNDISNVYNTTTDSLTIPNQASLDKTMPLGELHLDAGIVVLFLDKIENEYDYFNSDNFDEYAEGFGGNGRIQINSTVFNAILFNNEFNRSTNPTYFIDGSSETIKPIFRENPLTYPTMIGLYNVENELVAVGRFSQLFQKNPLNSATVKAELSY